MDEILKDSRFSHIAKDARFKSIPKKEKKVKIDKRFQSMFTDSRFSQKCYVDKRGRPTRLENNGNLEKYYDLSDDSEEEAVQVSNGDNDSKQFKLESENAEKNLIKKTKESRKLLTPKIREKLKDLTIDYARGEGRLLSDSSSEEDSESEENEEEELDHDWGEMDKDAESTNDATPRIAVCNMDWDRLAAQDLMVLFNSFLPAQGVLLSVKIYPSDFGLKRMAEEDKKGPMELTESNLKVSEKDEDEELTEEQRENLRKYQLKRLRYFYAILTFDSARTADHIYKECDGLEYESSMNRLDLRFVPDDTTFEQEPKQFCTEMPQMGTYTPRLFRTTALTQVKVDLTWDETDPDRQDLIRAVHSGKCTDEKLNGYLAVSSSEDEQEDERKLDDESKPVIEKNSINKYKALLADLEKTEESKKQEVSMEVTWDLKLEQKAAQKVKEAVNKEKDKVKTPFEKFLEKKKEKRKKKLEDTKQEVKKEPDSSGEELEQAFSDDDIPSDVDLNDPFFKEELDNMATKKNSKKKKKLKKPPVIDEMSQQEKAELELLMMDEKDEGDKRHFSLKDIEDKEKILSKKKRKRKIGGNDVKSNEDNFKIDVKDERFSAIYSSHLYNVDPAEANFKATDGMKAIIAEKQRRIMSAEPEKNVTTMEPTKKLSAELNILVKSVKRKANNAKIKKN